MLMLHVDDKVMIKGKKSVSEQIVYGAFEIVREKSKRDPLEYFPSTEKCNALVN
jgi:small subunit ribosomal protein S7